MLEKFNLKLNDVIFESLNVSPKFIDKDFQCSYNKVDLFTVKGFFRKFEIKDLLISQNFLKNLFEKIKIKCIKNEKSIIIYVTKLSLVLTGVVFPCLGNRHQIIFLNSWKSDKIPNIETTGQIRVIL